MTLARSGWALSLALAVMAEGSLVLADDHDAAAGGGRVLPDHLSATLVSATLVFANDDDRAVNTNFRTF
jgi:hypothetical protein